MTVPEIIAIIASVVGVFGSLSAIFFAFHNNSKADLSDFKKEIEDKTRTDTKLDEIYSKVSEIKTDMSDTKKEVQNLSERFAVLENSVKTAHKRIDGVEERILKLEG